MITQENLESAFKIILTSILTGISWIGGWGGQSMAISINMAPLVQASQILASVASVVLVVYTIWKGLRKKK